MPIRPSERHRYPQAAEWRAIRRRILDRANHQCEFCGIQNGAIGRRRRDGTFQRFDGVEIEIAGLEGIRLTRIVLTIAHLDHTPENNDPSNLRALCQRCHLRYDRDHHQHNARQTRLRKKDRLRVLLEGIDDAA